MGHHRTITLIFAILSCIMLSSTMLLREGSLTRTEASDQTQNDPRSSSRDFTNDDFWADSSTVKIYTTTESKSVTPVWSREENTIRLSAARNEYESFQMAFRPMSNIAVTITINQPVGGSILGTGNISLYMVKYAGSYSPDPLLPLIPDHNGTTDPVTLEPGSISWDLDIPSHVTTTLWVTIYIPHDTPAGDYVSNITFAQSGGEIIRKLNLHVWDFTLPDESTLATWFESTPGIYAAYSPFDHLDPEHLDFMKKVYEKFETHRITPGKLITTEPWDDDFEQDAGLNVTMNFTRSDPLMEYYMDELGIDRFEFPLTLFDPVEWNSPEYDFSAPPYEPTENYSRVIGQYVKEVADHYRERGWLERSVVYYCDEPYAYSRTCHNPISYPPYSLQRNISSIIEENAPDLRHLIVKEMEPALYGSGDIWNVPHSSYHMNDAAVRREYGEECWWGDVTSGIEKPAIGQRAIYWHSFNERVDGVKCWNVNYWNYNTVNNDPWQGSSMDGDGYLLYPGGTIGLDDDVIISIRLELTRDGLEDYEYLTKYADIFGRESAEAVSRAILPASEFASDIQGEVSGAMLYETRDYLARAIESGRSGDQKLWRHCLNGTKSGPGPWDDLSGMNDYGDEGIAARDGVSKTWCGDGAFELAFEESATILEDCETETGWTSDNQSSMNSSVRLETSLERHTEGLGALNFSFQRNNDPAFPGGSDALYGSVIRSSFAFHDLRNFDILEFDCTSDELSLYNFRIELGLDGGDWNYAIGQYSVTGTLPGRWHHCIIDISNLARSNLNHIRISTFNNMLERPFTNYSVLMDNFTVRSANRVNTANITFDPIDLGLEVVGKWNVELPGSYPLPEGCDIRVDLRTSASGTMWDDWRELTRDNGTLFSHYGDWTPGRFVQIRASLLGSDADKSLSPLVSEVRLWHAPAVHTDLEIPLTGFHVVPGSPDAGMDIHFEFSLVNPADTEVEGVMVRITADPGNAEMTVWEDMIDLKPGTTDIITENVTLIADDYLINASLVPPREVIDTDGSNNGISHPIHVNALPTAVIRGEGVAESHKPVSFDGTDSSDPDGEITAYRWDMGDGSILHGEKVEYIYLVQGTFTVTLTVTDDTGSNDTVSHVIQIELPVPTVEIRYSPPVNGTVLTEYLLYAVVFDPLDAIREYKWVLPGGQERKGQSISWQFAEDGTYNVTLAVSLIYAPYEVTTWKHILINNIRPDVRGSASTLEASPGDPITFTADGTHDVDDDDKQLSFRWAFGDGSFSTDRITQHSYDNAGRYKVNLTVTDDNGELNWTTFEIFIHSDFPVAYFEVPEIYVNETVLFDGSNSTDSDGEIVSFVWELRGSGINGSLIFKGDNFRYVFPEEGDYILNLTVRDNIGDEGSIEMTFHVAVRPEPAGGDSGTSRGSGVYIWMIIIAVVVIAGGVVFFLFFVRKKEEGDESTEEETEEERELRELEKKKEYEEIYGTVTKMDGGETGGEDGDEIDWA